MPDHDCPSAVELLGFALGTLPLPGLERVVRHLDACPTCEEAVNSLDRVSDPIVAAIRRPALPLTVAGGPPAVLGGPQMSDRLGDFQVVREIGRGGMGIVYEAEQVSLGRRVALKVLPRHALLEPESLERFRRESRAVAGLHHTNIVQVFGTGEQDGLHYFVMELVPGVGLDRVLRELKPARQAARRPAPDAGQAAAPGPSLMAVVRGLLSGASSRSDVGLSAERDALLARARAPEAPLPPSSSSGFGRPYWARVGRVGMQVAEALAHAHAFGVVHRDIKPSNLLLDEFGTVWVTDFGLAKAADEQHALTRSGNIVGTLRYLPPECFEGRADARGDIYSLGLTLYELATLRDAFPDADRNVQVRRKLDTDLPRPRRANPNVPRDLETIILEATARDPNHRYQTAADLAADLRRFVEDRPVRARRTTALERFWRWCRRDPRTASLLGALLLAVGAGLLGVATQWRRAEWKARSEAVARARADRAQELARADLYLSEIAQARLEWRLNNLARAERLLEECEPERRGWEWHYLRGVNRPESAWLANPGLSMVFGVGFGPDGRSLAFTGWDYYNNHDGRLATPAEVWNVSSGRKPWPALAVRGVGLRPAFSPDGRLIALSGPSGPVSLWDAASGKLVREIEAKGYATFSPDGRLMAVAGASAIAMHDVDSGRPVRRWRSRGGRVCFSPDGSLLAQSGAQAVRLLSVDTGEEAGSLPYGPDDLKDLYFPEWGPEIAFGPEGKRVVTATNPPRVWDVETRRPIHALGGHVGVVPGVAFGPDGLRIATGGADGTVRLWDARTGAELAVLRGHTGLVSCVAFHPDGLALISGGRQPGDVKIWDLTRSAEHGALSGGGAWSLVFDERDRLERVAHTGRIRTHEPETGRTEEGPRIDVAQKWVSPGKLAVFSGDGRLVAAASSDARLVKVFDARTGARIATLRGADAPPRQLAFSRDGRRVAAATTGRQAGPARGVWVWDALSGRTLANFRTGTPVNDGRPQGSVALSPDGRFVAFDDHQSVGAPGADGPTTAGVRLRDLAGLEGAPFLPADGENIISLTFSLDGTLIAAGDLDGRVLAWETATGQRRCEDRLELPALDLAFHPNGRRLAAVNRELVTIWDVQTGKSILTLRGAPPRPTDFASNATLAWSRDGRWLAAVNWDGTVALWDGDEHGRPDGPGWFRQVPSARAYAWHLDQAETACAAGNASGAAFHLDRVNAVGPPDLASRHRRGRLRLLRGDWKRAADDYAAVFAASEPDRTTAWLDFARLLLLVDDQAGYRRLVPRMIAHCGDRSDLGNPEPEEAQASVLAPGGAEAPLALVDFAERACKARHNSPSALWSLSLAHYRAGQWAKALARAEEAIARGPETAWLSWPVLALGHARLGHGAEAARWLARAREHREREQRRRETEAAWFTAPEWADFEIVYREALALVEGNGAADIAK